MDKGLRHGRQTGLLPYFCVLRPVLVASCHLTAAVTGHSGARSVFDANGKRLRHNTTVVKHGDQAMGDLEDGVARFLTPLR